MAGERPINPHLFDQWAVLLAPPVHEDREATDRIREAIDGMPSAQRDVINGVFYETVTKTEIARRLGVSRHDVRNLLVEALEALKGALS